MCKFVRSTMALVAGFMLVSTVANAQSSMTDEQVLEYVQQAMAEGKDRDDIARELSLKGVNRAQAQRVYALYQSRSSSNQAKAESQDVNRSHSVNGSVADDEQVNSFVTENATVYGRNIFRNKSLNFAPSENLATPRNYRLGPGDEVIIDIFGRNQTTLRSVISPEGSINVDVLGPVYLSGMTIDEANKYLKKRLGQIYGGLGREGTDMRLSLGQIRTIQVNIVGEVPNPGTYVLSAFATAFHALYRAGGVVEPGTVRDIKVVRDGKVVARVDVYQFLMKGNLNDDIRLEEGDVILVSPYKSLVSIEGAVKRPMYFEMKEGENLDKLLEYAGGFSNGANTASVTVFRQRDKAFEVRTVEDKDYASFPLITGDRIEVGEIQSRFENRISIHGFVYLPGTYELGEVRTAKGLVEKAGGLLPEAFTDRVVVHREHADKTMEVFSLNLTDIMAGKKPDFVLQNNDELYIASSYDLKDQGTMTISGMVKKPGSYPFAENTTIEDFIIMAGGLQDGASTSRVDVTRRKKDRTGMVATSDVGEMYTFSLKDGLIADGSAEFVLEPYDEVRVHRSPSYNEQRHFTVAGEVNFPGQYTITNREERISDLIEKAGGLTEFAYIKGARLVREATPEEITQARELGQLLVKQIDSTAAVNMDRNTLKTGTRHYSISLDLESALANPGGPSDVILRENDRLEIPVESNVVRVFGAVMYPTAVNWNEKMTVADYIDAAGGYSQHARRSKKYLVSMGGRAKKVYSWNRIEPGSEIFVPDKEKKNEKTDFTGLIAISSAAASLGTLGVAVTTLVSNLNKNK